MKNIYKKIIIMFVMVLGIMGMGVISDGYVANASENEYIPKKDYSNNLVAKWVFDDTNKDYVDGNIIKDVSGNGYDGTMNNLKFVDDPDLGKCAYFNGTNANVQFSDKIIPIGKKSIKVNVKKTTRENGYLLITFFDGNNEVGCNFHCTSNGMRMTLETKPKSLELDMISSKLCDNTKGNILLYTWDGTKKADTAKMYAGNLKEPLSIGTSKFEEKDRSTRNLSIGKIGDWGTFEGYIQSIEIYNEVLEYDKIDQSISLDKSTLNLKEATSSKLTATTTPAGAEITWKSSDESVATVDSNGNVKAIKEGQVTITVQIKDTDVKATCVVTVTKEENPVEPDEPTDPDQEYIINTAYAKGDNTNNASGQVTIIFKGNAEAQLKVIKTADVDSVYVGDHFTYTIEVTNTSDKVAKSVVIKDSAPNHIQFIPNEVTATQGKVDSSSTDKDIVVNVGDIQPLGKVTIKIPVLVIE